MRSSAAKGVRRLLKGVTRRFMQRIHHAAHRREPELREVEPCKVLVLAPHMDDEVIGPGATLLRHAQAGSEIEVFFTTNSAGSSSDPLARKTERERRRAEADAAIDFLGAKLIGVAEFEDGELSRHESELGDRLAAVISECQPRQIFCPFVSDMHRDHQATAAGLAEALKNLAGGWRGEVWGYEVWSTLWPNVAVDCGGEWLKRKAEAIQCYPSQIAHMNYVDAALGLNRYRGLRVRCEAAEAFVVTDADEWIQLGELLNEA
jgi:LmbE family N-acetylglucosaminyl deacetylase